MIKNKFLFVNFVENILNILKNQIVVLNWK